MENEHIERLCVYRIDKRYTDRVVCLLLKVRMCARMYACVWVVQKKQKQNGTRYTSNRYVLECFAFVVLIQTERFHLCATVAVIGTILYVITEICTLYTVRLREDTITCSFTIRQNSLLRQ